MLKIELLSMPGCGHCAHAKQVLDKVTPDYKEVEVIIHDVTKEPELAGQYMLMSAPGIVINGELVFSGGVEEAKLREYLDNIKD